VRADVVAADHFHRELTHSPRGVVRAEPRAGVARSSRVHNKSRVARRRFRILASACDSPVTIRCAGGIAESDDERVVKLRSAFPCSTAMHPSITESRPRLAQSDSMLCLGVSPQMNPGDIKRKATGTRRYRCAECRNDRWLSD
jgi:hypothetical protein